MLNNIELNMFILTIRKKHTERINEKYNVIKTNVLRSLQKI